MTALKIVATLLIGSSYLVAHWSLYVNTKRFQHWTLADTLDTTFRTRSDLRDFWTKIAFFLLLIDFVLSYTAISQDWPIVVVFFALFFIFKLSSLEVLHRT
ncbi:hypothetical protein IT407_03790 [Candidatus Uhrbacteria bacterium]|nr:hypothetical protein [Candidatus Uhrbacteria bacterium]